ncbi:flagellar brake protein [Bacillus niameyensis]|uniref:flagellar brake protein n=1 Tax=Bacillus niameyensis TaxID=1522308 RepID=UPI0007863AF5|nr:flagellar brake domain-containing protein [Bacillus niameyensis]
MFKVGMELILELSHNDQTEQLRSKVSDFTDNMLLISYPVSIESNRIVYLPNGEHLFASFSDKNTGATYLFKTKIINRFNKQIPMLALALPNEQDLMKIQRRQFVRVKTAIDISLDFPERNTQLPTITDDLSGGGCAVVIPEHSPIVRGDFGRACIVLPFQDHHYKYLNLDCRITRRFERNKIHLLSVQFLNLTNTEQQQLIRYTFDKQLQYRKKGILVE